MLSAMTLAIFDFDLYFPSNRHLTVFDYISDVTVILATIVFVFKTYKINTAGDNKFFTKRYICLSLPITLKSSVVSIFLLLPGLIYSSINGPSLEELEAMDPNTQIELALETEIMFCMALILTYFYAYWRYTTAFKIASGQKEYDK